MSGDGTIDRTEWTYNQSAMLGGYRLLHAATGDKADLPRAELIAEATLSRFLARRSSEPTAFAAIFFRRLLALAREDGWRRYLEAAQTYADSLWRARRRQLFDQAAVVQVYAALAARGDA